MGSIPEAAAAAASSKNENCGLGLQRILNNNNDGNTLSKASPLQKLGPVIPLCPRMYLGRTPPSVLKAMATFKPLDATWSAEEFSSFSQKHQKIAGEYALLGIKGKVLAQDSASQLSKDEKLLLSVSRKLLRVVKYTNHDNTKTATATATAAAASKSTRSITLQRCAEAVKGDGRPARQIDVVVYRRPKASVGIENENNSNSSASTNTTSTSTSTSNGTNTPNRKTSSSSSSSSGSDIVRVKPSSRVVLREGDTLMILNENYRYRVVALDAKPAAKPVARKSTETRTENPAEAKPASKSASKLASEIIDLVATSSSNGSGSSGSSSSSSSNNNIPISPFRAMGTTTRRSLTARRNLSRTSIGSGRASMSSLNDRTIAMDIEPNINIENHHQDEIIQILSSSDSEDSGQKQKSRADKTIDSTPSSKATPARDDNKYKFETPDGKPKEIINLAESSKSKSNSRSSNSGSKNNPATEKTHTHAQNQVGESSSSRNIFDAAKSSSSKTTSSVDIGNGSAMEENQPIDREHNNSEINTNDNATKCNNTENAEAETKTKTNMNKNDTAESHNNDSSNRYDTRRKTRSSNRLRPRASDAQSSNEKEQSSAKKSDSDNIGNRLRQKGLRIKTVLLQKETNEGIVVERPIREVLSMKKNLPKEPIKEEAIEADVTSGTILSLESPTRRFWDPSWSSEAGKADPTVVTPIRNDVTSTTTTTTEAPPSLTMVSPFPSPGDMPASMANFYWNALNSSRPREGAWYLNASMMAANTVPGPLLCEKWMTLLTWGPLLLEAPASSKRKATKRNFSWDGPRIDFALGLWKKALGLHPRILLPRMIGAAPGGPSEWWKTCLGYDELSEEPEEDHTREGLVRQSNTNSNNNADDSAGAIEAAQKAIRCLRMRSARLEAFLHLMKSNLAFEEEQQREKIRTQKEQDKNKESTPQPAATERIDDSDNDDDTCSSDEEDEDDSAEEDDCLKSLVLLREIRSFGAKPALRLVAQAMAKFWVSQKKYLGYSGDSNSSSMLLEQNEDPYLWSEHCSLEQEHSEVVEEIATQLAEVLGVMRKVIESSFNTTNPEATALEGRRRRSRRRRFLDESSSSKLSNKEIGDLLWNAMDLEVRERLPKPKKQKRKPSSSECYAEPAPREAFLVDWLWALKESIGNEFAMELAEKVGVEEHYDALLDL